MKFCIYSARNPFVTLSWKNPVEFRPLPPGVTVVADAYFIVHTLAGILSRGDHTHSHARTVPNHTAGESDSSDVSAHTSSI